MKNNLSIKRLSALAAIACGALFTLTALLSIWQVAPFGDIDRNPLSQKIVPSLALLTVAFIALLIILRILEEKK